MDFDRDGARLFERALSAAELDAFRNAADGAIGEGPGARLLANGAIAGLIAKGSPSRIARHLIGEGAKPVRAVFFDKTAKSNWAVGWHQDRVIVVKARKEVPGFTAWSTKRGLLHVSPPHEIMVRMATLRLHIDDCGPDNAPLKVAVGSHRLGFVPAAEAGQRVTELSVLTCLANAGDVWAYSTPILHASDRAVSAGRRRVLQVDYAVGDLPGGLKWRGISA